MPTSTSSPAVKKKHHVAVAMVDGRSHAALMRSMRAQVDEITSSPEKSIAFLKRAGLLTPTGKVKKLIRA
jgi:hypothetical protein